MQFSVIICTYNRCNNLQACVKRILEQEGLESFKWELVIVDNNSTDITHEIVQRLRKDTKHAIRYYKEETQGLNYARNCGILNSTGKYFVFVDDDIFVGKNWLSSLYSMLEKKEADAVGGRIHLDKSVSLPKWITKDMYGFLGFQDYGEESFKMNGITHYPFGGNMSFNRKVIKKIGFFNPNLGRRGSGNKRSELFKGSETDYFHRLAKAGGQIFYQPDAIVYHKVMPFQITKKYFRTIHYNAGYQKAKYNTNLYKSMFFGVPLFLFPQLFRALEKYFIQIVKNSFNVAFRQEMTIFHFVGMIIGFYDQKK